MRNAVINSSLERGLTRDRLEKYLAETADNLDQALSLYERNTRLSEAFYTPLQSLEICLRNKLHEKLSNAFGDDWFQNGAPALQPDICEDIQKARSSLEQSKKEITPGRIVAELSFGAWVSLMGPRYDATLWRTCIFRAFTENGRGMKRDRVHRRFNALRRFRNRIAHHEPIYQRNVSALHGEVIEAIQWMSEDTAQWALHHSRLPAVFAAQ